MTCNRNSEECCYLDDYRISYFICFEFEIAAQKIVSGRFSSVLAMLLSAISPKI